MVKSDIEYTPELAEKLEENYLQYGFNEEGMFTFNSNKDLDIAIEILSEED